MRQRMLAVLLALLFVFQIPTSYARGSYEPEAALEYAKEHWYDGRGLCAEFVSRCLQAGGLRVFAKGCTTLSKQFYAIPGIEIYRFPLKNNTKYKIGELSKKLSPGDVGLFFCSFCDRYSHEGYCHAMLYTGVDAKGYLLGYSHNPEERPSRVYWYDVDCYDCGNYYTELIFFHFPKRQEGLCTNGTAWVCYDAAGERRTGWVDWQGDSYYFYEDGTAKEGWLADGGILYHCEKTGQVDLSVQYRGGLPVVQDSQGKILSAESDGVPLFVEGK